MLFSCLIMNLVSPDIDEIGNCEHQLCSTETSIRYDQFDDHEDLEI